MSAEVAQVQFPSCFDVCGEVTTASSQLLLLTLISLLYTIHNQFWLVLT